MSAEKQRSCGYRKLHGTYMVCDPGEGFACPFLPHIIESCPVCGGGIKQSRGLTKILPKHLFSDVQRHNPHCLKCLVDPCPMKQEGTHLLAWVGERFYSPQSFTEEAQKMGISKRISAIPKGFELDKTWVFLAHPKAVSRDDKQLPGIFYAFKPKRIERIVTETELKNTEEMDRLRKQGITPVAVPENDEDHMGSVYDAPKHYPYHDHAEHQSTLPVNTEET